MPFVPYGTLYNHATKSLEVGYMSGSYTQTVSVGTDMKVAEQTDSDIDFVLARLYLSLLSNIEVDEREAYRVVVHAELALAKFSH